MKDKIYSALYAGLSIALGCILYLMIPDKILGAFLFSMGLLNVRLAQLYLYTGKIQSIKTERMAIYDLGGILLMNSIAAIVTGLFCLLCLPLVSQAGAMLVAGRLAMPYYSVFGMSIVCGALMTIATRKNTPLWVSSCCVLAFIAAGGLHSIADAFYYTLALWPQDAIWRWLVTVLGNFYGGIIFAINNNKAPE